jgi:hypothetical protein
MSQFQLARDLVDQIIERKGHIRSAQPGNVAPQPDTLCVIKDIIRRPLSA